MRDGLGLDLDLECEVFEGVLFFGMEIGLLLDLKGFEELVCLLL